MLVDGWTDGRYRAFITSVIRSGFRRFPNKYKVLKNAIVGRKLNPSSGKMATFYTCAKCKGEFTSTNIEVDHKKPVVDPKEGFIDWDTFISRLYCPVANLQVLCKPCHKKKTATEKVKRVKAKEKP